jgi:hypothetical protein
MRPHVTGRPYTTWAPITRHWLNQPIIGKTHQRPRERALHLAEEDEFLSESAQAQIKSALAGKADATVYSYPGGLL